MTQVITWGDIYNGIFPQKPKAMNYILTVTVTRNKSAKYHYRVLDENGTVISERRSSRKYVACTIDGQYYFGRVDLVGKGDHGRQVKWCIEQGRDPKPIAYLSPSMMEVQEGGQI